MKRGASPCSVRAIRRVALWLRELLRGFEHGPHASRAFFLFFVFSFKLFFLHHLFFFCCTRSRYSCWGWFFSEGRTRGASQILRVQEFLSRPFFHAVGEGRGGAVALETWEADTRERRPIDPGVPSYWCPVLLDAVNGFSLTYRVDRSSPGSADDTRLRASLG